MSKSATYLESMENEELCKVASWLERNKPSAVSVVGLIKSVLRFKYPNWKFYFLRSGDDLSLTNEMGETENNWSYNSDILCVNISENVGKYMFYAESDIESMISEIQKLASASQKNKFYAVPREAADKLRSSVRIGPSEEFQCLTYILPITRKLPDTAECVEENGKKLRKIDESFAAVMHSEWVLRDVEGQENTQSELKAGNGYGVFVGDELVSWAILRYYGEIGMVYTRPDFRGCGLATWVISAIARDLREYGMPVLLTTDETNLAAMSFYEKLGFEKCLHVNFWL